ncbi:hypothetical protein [Marinobacter nauticus]|uniref:hypothetical protein n=1 Tax=Marinobacter nauticus TaxID=2743 RepID=UPI001C994030|nr:hypothetical protein [Marinobacter nauticus]MBY5962096.1 hypothetical protein [Marinobacter nauticus]
MIDKISRWALYGSDGIIKQIYTGPESEAKLQNSYYIQIADDLDDSNAYVRDGKIMAKQQFSLSINKSIITADGVDTITITNIPADTLVTWWDGQQDIITDGILEITSDLEGEYKIILDHPHYLQESLTFEARN